MSFELVLLYIFLVFFIGLLIVLYLGGGDDV
jgi:hypothetical protein